MKRNREINEKQLFQHGEGQWEGPPAEKKAVSAVPQEEPAGSVEPSGSKGASRKRSSASPPKSRRRLKSEEALDESEPTDVDLETIDRELEKAKEGYEGDASFNLYLREIGQTRLLTPEEENKLAARIQKGDKKAREEMIKANLRLVVKIARDYEGYGLPLLDLVNEGNIGLMKAVERFDPSKGAKLSTYSAWWIKQSIKRALANQSKTIRLPVHMVEKVFNMRRVSSMMQEELGRDPTDDELAEELGITAAQVAQWRAAASRPSSLEAPIGDDESSTIGEIVADEGAITPYQQLEGKTRTEMLEQMISKLDPREATILKYRFGLEGEGEQTLEEIGERFGVTRERIRQVQMIALEKLRKMIEKFESVGTTA